ncbi:hypothetical protein L1887_49915 [Cichorium endivia]|nr:hypothetical protein L1887_49915 [Cichorium endivia]
MAVRRGLAWRGVECRGRLAPKWQIDAVDPSTGAARRGESSGRVRKRAPRRKVRLCTRHMRRGLDAHARNTGNRADHTAAPRCTSSIGARFTCNALHYFLMGKIADSAWRPRRVLEKNLNHRLDPNAISPFSARTRFGRSDGKRVPLARLRLGSAGTSGNASLDAAASKHQRPYEKHRPPGLSKPAPLIVPTNPGIAGFDPKRHVAATAPHPAEHVFGIAVAKTLTHAAVLSTFHDPDGASVRSMARSTTGFPKAATDSNDRISQRRHSDPRSAAGSRCPDISDAQGLGLRCLEPPSRVSDATRLRHGSMLPTPLLRFSADGITTHHEQHWMMRATLQIAMILAQSSESRMPSPRVQTERERGRRLQDQQRSDDIHEAKGAIRQHPTESLRLFVARSDISGCR